MKKLWKAIKKFFKFIIITAVVLLVLLAVAVGVGLYYLDQILQTGIERGGSAALGVSTKVDTAHLALTRGELALQHLNIANPEGYSEPFFMTVGQMDAAVTPRTLIKDEIEVPYIRLTDLYLSLEKKDKTANYEVILNNIQTFQAKFSKLEAQGKGSGTEDGASSSSKRFVIKEIIISNVRVDAKVQTLGGLLGSRTIRVQIPELRVKNIGNGTDNSVAVEEVTSVITMAVLRAVVEQGGGVLPAEISSGLRGGLDALGALGGFSVEVIGEVGKGVFDGAGKMIEGVGKGFEDLFGGKKEGK